MCRTKWSRSIDLASGKAVKVGREGQGPEEYMLPMGLFGMPDGSAVLQDMGNRRFLPILADGKIGKSFSPPTPPPRTPAPREGMVFIGAGLILNVRGADGRGNLYFQGMALPASGNTHGRRFGPHHDLGSRESQGRHRRVAAGPRQ